MEHVLSIGPPPGLEEPFQFAPTARGLEESSEQSQRQSKEEPSFDQPNLQHPPGLSAVGVNLRRQPPPGLLNLAQPHVTGEPIKLPLPSYSRLPESVPRTRPRHPPGVWGNASFASAAQRILEEDDTQNIQAFAAPWFLGRLASFHDENTAEVPRTPTMEQARWSNHNGEEVPETEGLGSIQSRRTEEIESEGAAGTKFNAYHGQFQMAHPYMPKAPPKAPEPEAKAKSAAKSLPAPEAKARLRSTPSASNMLLLDGAIEDAVGLEAEVSEGERSFQWHVDAKKLESNDRQIISPNFTLSEDFKVELKLMIKPSCRSFQRSKGVGSVEVKFVGQPPAPKIRFSISVDHQPPCAPLEHDFGKGLVCTSEELHNWNFRSAIEGGSFLVSLHVFEVLRSDAV